MKSLLVACCAALTVGVLVAADKVQEGNESVLALDRARVQKEYPSLDLGLLLRFYEEYSPDLLAEWRRRSVRRPAESGAYFGRLAAHFLELEAVRRSDVNEYERLLEYELLQGKVRALSHEIQRLNRMGKALLSQETEALRVSSLRQAKADLHELLERAFDESLRQQMREIERLESQVQLLRQAAEKRRMQRSQAIEDRFSRLTGE